MGGGGGSVLNRVAREGSQVNLSHYLRLGQTEPFRQLRGECSRRGEEQYEVLKWGVLKWLRNYKQPMGLKGGGTWVSHDRRCGQTRRGEHEVRGMGTHQILVGLGFCLGEVGNDWQVFSMGLDVLTSVLTGSLWPLWSKQTNVGSSGRGWHRDTAVIQAREEGGFSQVAVEVGSAQILEIF